MKKTRHSVRYRRLLQVLKDLRHGAGLTQTEVARKFGTHASFISKIESGERRLDVVELADFCKVYNASLLDTLRQAGLA